MAKYSDLNVDLYSQFQNIMNQYTGILEKEIYNEAMAVGKEAKEEIKKNTPKRDKLKKRGKNGKFGHYINSYTVIGLDKPFEKGCTLWNKQYQLSHLLERNHNISNQYGAKGRTHKNTTPFWKNTSEFVKKEFTRRVIEAIKRIK